jgi:hypothetical protein
MATTQNDPILQDESWSDVVNEARLEFGKLGELVSQFFPRIFNHAALECFADPSFSKEDRVLQFRSHVEGWIPRSFDEALPFLVRILWNAKLTPDSADCRSLANRYLDLLAEFDVHISHDELIEGIGKSFADL